MRWYGLVVIIGLLALLLLGIVQQRQMTAGLPPRHVCQSQLDAKAQAGVGAMAILGTGSMAPYIPAAPAGADPLKTVMGYAIASERPFKSILKGDLVVYATGWAKGLVIHQAAQKQGDKWIMSGLNNRQSESFEPISEKEFHSIIKEVYVW